MLFGKLPETPLLITSSLASSKQKTPTSIARQSDDLFTRRNLIFVSAVLLIFFAFTAHGTTIRRNKAMNNFETKKTFRNSIYLGDSVSDSDFSSSHITSNRIESTREAKVSDFFNTYKSIRSLCQGLSYQKCLKVRQLAKNWLKRKLHRTNRLSANTLPHRGSPALDKDLTHSPIKIRSDKLLSSPADVTEDSSVKSRQKRLASGDRRLVHLYCKTNFVLEILEDGKVVGNRVKSENAALEIQTVEKDGVVRFFSPSTNYFLAMNDKGRLYGTKTYSKEHCAFTERIQENYYSTYSTHILPDKRHNHRHRSKRSADTAWYVAIGRSGMPRKANRIRPSQSSAQFLPRPIS